MTQETRGALILCFDIPQSNSNERKIYRQLQKILKANGFFILQESVYLKLLRHHAQNKQVICHMETILPENGSFFMFPITLSSLKDVLYLQKTEFPWERFAEDIVIM